MTIWIWIAFIVLIIGFLALDLGVFNKTAHVISTNEALIWTALWVVLSLAFNVLIYEMYEQDWLGISSLDGTVESGKDAALEFFTGYLVEKSLSLDNIFVIAVIFSFFKVPAIHQHRVLFWGILGALVLRGLMIGLGTALVQSFAWINYVFGGILILTAVKMLLVGDEQVEPEKNPLVRLARRLFPISPGYEGHRFFTHIDGKRAITPLFLVLLVVESTDLLFAVDSIPAIFAVTNDPFIVFTSNVFAILGLRSLYFALSGIMDKFKYLKASLVFILAFVGVKMLLAHHHPIPIPFSLGVIVATLFVGVVASMLASHQATAPIIQQAAVVADATRKQIRRALIFLLGATVVLIGIAMIVLPGPAVVVIPAGLAILGTEFVWARRLFAKLKDASKRVTDSVGLTGSNSPKASDDSREKTGGS
ncbi:MAG: TerC/Alx family metal homeostasis membrane protein [Phycisphaerae bacterium]|nr:TerC/Alx family metal homeostasis membrane protein [Phycisphaerae bacterium]